MGVYQNAIEYFKRVADSRYVAAGLTSNVDLLVRWDTGVIQKWVDQYATGPRNISNVENMTDLVDMLLFRLPEGGTECFICEEVARTIESSLKMASYGVGGTGAQAACALGSFGVRSLVHLTSFGPQFADLLNYPPLSVYSNGKALPVRQFLRENPERYAPHFILQFHKGAALKFQDQSYTAPVANKIILSWDVLNSELPLDHGYFEYAKKNHATALLISGVSGIQQEENLDAKLKEIARLLEGFSQETMVYCECGPFFLKDGYGKYFKELGGKSDIIACSDEELFEINGVSHSSFGGNPYMLMGLLDKFFHTYHPRRGVVIHSRDVSMYYGNPLPEGRDVKSALAMGNMVASAKARYSDYGTREMVFSIADQPDSTVGLQRIKTLEKGGVIAVPTKPVEHPACTIGLGDSFTAGFLSCV